MRYRILSDCMVTPGEVLDRATLEIDNGIIAGVWEEFKDNSSVPVIDMRGHVLLPAFINAHDHFLGTWLPKVGRGNYTHWAQWNFDLRASEVIQERAKTTDFERYLLGSYKSICSGVTTASDHYPHEMNDPFAPKLPIRLITQYTLAHAISDKRLDWGLGIVKEFKLADGKLPFITHSSEGFDPDTRDEIQELDRLGALSDNTVLIHGIAFTADDVDLIARRGASVVWCPDSNVFMFNVTANIPRLLKAGINVALATDSCMTGAINLMAEIKCAREVESLWGCGSISNQDYVRMVTINPAKALRLQAKLGTLETGKLADILVLKRHADEPFESILKADPNDIVLLTIEGRPLLSQSSCRNLFDLANHLYSEVSFSGTPKLIVGEPLKLVERIRQALGFKKRLDFLPFAD